VRLVPTEERYPLQPLLDALGGATINAASKRIGIQLWEYAERGLTEPVADRCAIRARLHPAMVWPTWLDNGLTILDRLYLEQGWRQAWLWNERAA
jgi:hypothetical protein